MHLMDVSWCDYLRIQYYTVLYRVIQEKRSVFLEVVVSVIVREKIRANTCLILIGYRDIAF
jgi:hypothetical protein